jgi:hypothetical protein
MSAATTRIQKYRCGMLYHYVLNKDTKSTAKVNNIFGCAHTFTGTAYVNIYSVTFTFLKTFYVSHELTLNVNIQWCTYLIK